MKFTCPICGWPGLEEPSHDQYGAGSFDICSCCGVEYGYQDSLVPQSVLRARWISDGMPWWWSEGPPAGWDPVTQLAGASSPFACTVCGWLGLNRPPHDVHGVGSRDTCPCCGTRFTDPESDTDVARLRRRWADGGMRWEHRWGDPPPDWDPDAQLAAAGLTIDWTLLEPEPTPPPPPPPSLSTLIRRAVPWIRAR